MRMKLLNELNCGEKGRIVKISGTGSIRRRLLDMGLVSGSDIEMERVAPLGDPIEIKIKGYKLALRRQEAASIQVEVTQMTNQGMPLAMAKPGELVVVTGIKAGRGLQRRLADMGLTPGVQIRMINSGLPGPVLIDLRGSRLALGRGIALKILVKES